VWERIAERLAGRIVVLEPVERRHAEGLRRAAAHPEIWTLLPIDASTHFDVWLEHALAQRARGVEVPFATIDARTGNVLGSTRFLALRPEHRSLEIGGTWLAPDAWETGANVEAKLLQLTHAFETLGCVRVELKTDARNDRSRRAMEAIPAQFEGVHRRHRIERYGRRDSAWYSVIVDEWPEVKANLDRRVQQHVPP
jgi:RimJ/RimL family protein N-acetyltransferase